MIKKGNKFLLASFDKELGAKNSLLMGAKPTSMAGYKPLYNKEDLRKVEVPENGKEFESEKNHTQALLHNSIVDQKVLANTYHKEAFELSYEIKEGDLNRTQIEAFSKKIASLNTSLQDAQKNITGLTEKYAEVGESYTQAKFQNDAAYNSSRLQKEGHIDAALIQKKAQIEAAKIQQDPNEISQSEMAVFNLVKKYDVLKDPVAFQNMVNNSTDEQVKKDAKNLEKDLAKLGMNLKVDGIIDQNTINSVEALISKNAPAIKVYKEITGTDPLKPTVGSPVEKESEINPIR